MCQPTPSSHSRSETTSLLDFATITPEDAGNIRSQQLYLISPRTSTIRQSNSKATAGAKSQRKPSKQRHPFCAKSPHLCCTNDSSNSPNHLSVVYLHTCIPVSTELAAPA